MVKTPRYFMVMVDSVSASHLRSVLQISFYLSRAESMPCLTFGEEGNMEKNGTWLELK